MPADQATSHARAIPAEKRVAEAEAEAAYRHGVRGRINALSAALHDIWFYAAPPIASAFVLVAVGETWQVAVLAGSAGAIVGAGVTAVIGFVLMDVDETVATTFLRMVLPGIVTVGVALLIGAAL